MVPHPERPAPAQLTLLVAALVLACTRPEPRPPASTPVARPGRASPLAPVSTPVADSDAPALKLAMWRRGPLQLLPWRQQLYLWFGADLLALDGAEAPLRVPVGRGSESQDTVVVSLVVEPGPRAERWLSTETDMSPSEWNDRALFRYNPDTARWADVVPVARWLAYRNLVPWRGLLLATEHVVNEDVYLDREDSQRGLARLEAQISAHRGRSGRGFVRIAGDPRSGLPEPAQDLIIDAARPTEGGGILALASDPAGDEHWVHWPADAATPSSGPLPNLSARLDLPQLLPTPRGFLIHGSSAGNPYVALVHGEVWEAVDTAALVKRGVDTATTVTGATETDDATLWITTDDGVLWRGRSATGFASVQLPTTPALDGPGPTPMYWSVDGSWRMQAPATPAESAPRALDVASSGGALWIVVQAGERTLLWTTGGVGEARHLVDHDIDRYERSGGKPSERCRTTHLILDDRLDDAEYAALVRGREKLRTELSGLVDHIYVASRAGSRVLAAEKTQTLEADVPTLERRVAAALGAPVQAAWCAPPRLLESVLDLRR